MDGENREGKFRIWGLGVLIVLLSLAESRIMYFLHQRGFPELIESIFQLTQGRPAWVEYQNRLLGPWLIRGISELTGASFANTYQGTVIFFHLAKNFLVFFLARRLTKDSWAGGRAVALGSLLYLVLQGPRWLYPWDYLDIMIFSLFLFGVLSRKGKLFFTLLFIPAILNRESGLFIAMWLMIDSLTLRQNGSFSFRLREPTRLLLGLGLMATGQAFIFLARKWLLVVETGVSLNPEFAAERPFHFARNAEYSWWALTHPGFDLGFLPHLVFASAPLFLLLWLRKTDDLLFKQALLIISALVSIFLLGLVNETRVFTMLIPFAVFLPMYRQKEKMG